MALRVLSALAALSFLVACAGGEPTGTSSIITELDAHDELDPTAEPEVIEESERPLEDATMIFVVRNPRGVPLSDIPLILRRDGARGSEKLVTGKGGSLRIKRPAAYYRVSIPVGCRGTREINEARGARIGVVAGRTHRINLKADAKRRYVAGSPLVSDLDAPWTRDATVKLTFQIYDRCKDREAPGVSFADLTWRSSSNLEIVDKGSMRADASSMGRLKVRCTAEGDASLWLQDRDDPADRVDLLAFRPPLGFDGSANWCG